MPRNYPHIIIGIVYFPPKSNDWLYTQHLIDSIDTITSTHPNAGIFLIGDFNQLKDRHLVTNLKIKQIVKKPTRGQNILDKVYTTMPDIYTSNVIDGIQNSDHDCVLVCPTEAKYYQKKWSGKSIIYRRNQTHVRKCLLASELKQKNWTTLYSLPTCQSKYDFFTKYIQELMDTYIPIKEEIRNHNDKPWVTKKFTDLILARQKAWKNGRNTMYNFYRNKVNRLAKNLRKNYYESKIKDRRKTNPRSWWKATKSLIGQSHNLEISSYQQILQDECDNNIQTLADNLNDFLISVCSDIEPLPEEENTTNDQVTEDEFLATVEDVSTKLSNIKLEKAIGPDGIPNWILRDLAPIVSKPLTSIFNASFLEKYIPEGMKSADIVPVPKKSPVTNIKKDVRPISLTPVISRIMESIVRDNVRKHTNGKIDQNQYGGIPNSSTTTALNSNYYNN